MTGWEKLQVETPSFNPFHLFNNKRTASPSPPKKKKTKTKRVENFKFIKIKSPRALTFIKINQP